MPDNRTEDFVEKFSVGDFPYECIIHPDNTVNCYRFYATPGHEIRPNRTIKKILRDKYDGLLFIDDVELMNESDLVTLEDAQQVISDMSIKHTLSSSSYNKKEHDLKTKEFLSNPNWSGTAYIGEITSNKAKPTKEDFRLANGVREERLLDALKIIHPDKDIDIRWTHRKYDKYANKGVYARHAYTYWTVTIK